MISDNDLEIGSGGPILIYNSRQLVQMFKHIAKHKLLALDTESNSLFAYYSRICLIQLSVPIDDSNLDPLHVVDFLVDPLRLSTDEISALGTLITEQQIEVVMHAAENDVLLLQREYGFRFPKIFDTQLAARFLGWKAVGLAALLETHFGVISDKRMQRTNWGERPLTPQQIAYAQMDTHYLLAMRQMFITQLHTHKRWDDTADAFQRLSRIDASSRTSNERTLWQMSVSREIVPRHTGMLEALWEWRESEAQRLNRPSFKVMNDEVLAHLAEQRPETLAAFKSIGGMSDHQVHRYGQALLRVIRENQERRPPAAPEPHLSAEQMLDKSTRRLYDKLRAWRSEAAMQRSIPPELVFTNQTLIEIAQIPSVTLSKLQSLADVGQWKSQLYGDEILRVLAS